MEIARISSPANSSVKEAVKLKRKRYRHHRRLFLTEGEDLLAAALNRGVVPRQVFLLEGKEEEPLRRLERFTITQANQRKTDVEIFVCSQMVMDKLSDLGGNSQVASIFEMFHQPLPELINGAGPVLYLTSLRDPGNVGTLIRSAAALGASAVMLNREAADTYSPKTIRATMGSIFQIPFFLDISAEEIISWASQNKFKKICAEAHAAEPVWSADLSGQYILFLGSERQGVPEELLSAADQTIQIPQIGDTESINVAMAGTAILYESMRQRSFGRDTA